MAKVVGLETCLWCGGDLDRTQQHVARHAGDATEFFCEGLAIFLLREVLDSLLVTEFARMVTIDPVANEHREAAGLVKVLRGHCCPRNKSFMFLRHLSGCQDSLRSRLLKLCKRRWPNTP